MIYVKSCADTDCTAGNPCGGAPCSNLYPCVGDFASHFNFVISSTYGVDVNCHIDFSYATTDCAILYNAYHNGYNDEYIFYVNGFMSSDFSDPLGCGGCVYVNVAVVRRSDFVTVDCLNGILPCPLYSGAVIDLVSSTMPGVAPGGGFCTDVAGGGSGTITIQDYDPSIPCMPDPL